MTSVLLHEVSTIVQLASAPKSVDTVRALCHDLRQPLAAILLPAGRRVVTFDAGWMGSSTRAQWLSDMVEGVIGGAADDRPGSVDVVDLAARCVMRSTLPIRTHPEAVGSPTGSSSTS